MVTIFVVLVSLLVSSEIICMNDLVAEKITKLTNEFAGLVREVDNTKSCSKKKYRAIKKQYEQIIKKQERYQKRILAHQNEGYIDLNAAENIATLVVMVHSSDFLEKIEKIELSSKGCL